MKLTRNSRVGTPQMLPSRTLICGIASPRDVDALDQRRDHLARVRTLHGDDRPLLGGRGEPDLEVGELGLEIVLHVGEHARRAAGRRRHVEAVRREAADDAVVHDEAGFAQHEAIAAAAGLELRPGVGVERFMNSAASGPTTSILPSVEASNRPTLARTARHSRATAACMSSPAAGNTRRASTGPTSSNTAPWLAAQSWMGVRRIGIEQLAARMAGESAEGHRRVGRAERGETHLRDRLVQHAGGDGRGAFMFEVLPWSVAMPVVV